MISVKKQRIAAIMVLSSIMLILLLSLNFRIWSGYYTEGDLESIVIRRLHDLGGVVLLVKRDSNLQRVARHLQRSVDETGANVLAVVGRHHIEPVRETEHRLCVHGSPLLDLADQTFPSYRPAAPPSGSSP